MKKINLKIIADALDESFEGWSQFLNKETGEVESLPEDRAYYEGDDYEADLERLDDSSIYALLPDQYQINEYEIMKDFARRSGVTELLTALHQKHPYRKFKDKINALDIDDLYYAFRENAYYDIAKDWCEHHGISYYDSRNKTSSEVKDSIMSNERLKCGIRAENIKPGRYRHYKGNEYEVLCMAKHSETEERMVVYKALYGEGLTWVRPASMWFEPVLKDGKEIKRFTYIGD